MKTLLQISAAHNCGAPGKIVEQIGLLAKKDGWNVYSVHGLRYSNPSQLTTLSSITTSGEYMHALKSLLFDMHGLGSQYFTKKVVEKIKSINPDVIHLHNLHGYYINYKVLFEYLKVAQKPVVWTLHDCWPFTGHCAYFDSVDCMRWKTGCHNCPLRRDYPTSFFFDRSAENYALKKSLFTQLKRCVMVPVSNWLGDITQQSFMGKFPINVIHNGIDLNIFRPMETNLRQRLGISPEKIVVLGLAAPWVPRKGYHDMITLSKQSDFQVVMVGVSNKQQKELPQQIISVSRTSNQQELAEYYNMADVFVNPTYSDNFPTTNLEALACGKPVVTYETGGSPEAVDEHTGVVLKQGDINGVICSIRNLKDNPFLSSVCRKRAEELFDKDKCFEKYIDLYNQLLNQ